MKVERGPRGWSDDLGVSVRAARGLADIFLERDRERGRYFRSVTIFETRVGLYLGLLGVLAGWHPSGQSLIVQGGKAVAANAFVVGHGCPGAVLPIAWTRHMEKRWRPHLGLTPLVAPLTDDDVASGGKVGKHTRGSHSGVSLGSQTQVWQLVRTRMHVTDPT